jgi:hypothetical protein
MTLRRLKYFGWGRKVASAHLRFVCKIILRKPRPRSRIAPAQQDSPKWKLLRRMIWMPAGAGPG